MEASNFKEIIAADPAVDLDTLGLSAEDRKEAEVFRDEMRALDGLIEQALNIDVPDLTMPSLPELDTGNVAQLPARDKPRFTTPAWIGIAASVALIAVIGVRTMTPTTYPSLADEVIAHLDHEPQALVPTSTPVGERELTRVVDGNGVELDRGVGLVTYAKSCVINGKTVPHLVIKGESGPVTLLLMPDEPVQSAVPLDGQSINGVILPVGDGSIAIIGERDEDLSKIEKQVVDSVTWSI